MPAQKPEFDNYAAQYEQLLKDPIRDAFADGAQFFHERKMILLRDFFRRHALDTRSASWLDAGCGKGELLSLGQPHFGKVTGCDPSAGMLDDAQGLNVQRQDDLGRLPFPDSSFDLVTAVCVYHHVPKKDRAALTREIVRVLKPGGHFAMIEHNPFNPATQLIVRRTPVDADAVLLTPGTARRLMRDARLQIRETSYFLYFPQSLYAKMAGLESALAWMPMGGQYAVYGRK